MFYHIIAMQVGYQFIDKNKQIIRKPDLNKKYIILKSFRIIKL